MADPELKLAFVAAALLLSACGPRHGEAARGSITVKLPPARAATPAPGFTFDTLGKPRPDRQS